MDDTSRDDSILEGLGPDMRQRLEAWLAGRATPDEIRAVERWAGGHTDREDLVRRIRRARQIAASAPELWDTEAAWERLVARSEGHQAEVVTFPARYRRRRPALRMAVRAAAAVVVLVAGAVLWQQGGTLLGPSKPAMQEIATGVGQRMRVSLSDGSELILAPMSRVRIQERFHDQRVVQLDGHAVFDVAPDSIRPFVVRSRGADTRVLGTRFSVQAFAADGFVDVAVAEGRVMVSPSGPGEDPPSGIQLSVDQAVRVAADGTLDPVRSVDGEWLLSWTTGRLIFDGVPLREVLRTLERRFGRTFHTADPSISTFRLTAEFEATAGAAEILRQITRSLGIEFRRSPEGFLLYTPVAAADGGREGDMN
ncbi:MAG TPA: FecR domain-containing protein [Longimicrobiales bacterium]|nr:FecR domain-containing protein [Longimicrobiales bacterium]